MNRSSIGTALQVENTIQLIVIVMFAVVASTLVRKGRADPAAKNLQPRQRIRPLLLECLDPVLAIVVVGPVLAHELTLDFWHVLAALIGASAGIPIGILRSRVQFVRAIKHSKSVVLTRSNAEYALIILLVILRSAEGSIRQSSSTLVTLLVAMLLALPVGESCARTISMVEKYRQSANESPSLGLPD
ncbi:MAG TPA: hypothetical protein VIJ40_04270 [Acidimicrobiales bacterium]